VGRIVGVWWNGRTDLAIMVWTEESNLVRMAYTMPGDEGDG